MEKSTPHSPSYRSDVVIIGAGISGINMACQLQRSLGVTDYVIYERSSELGGAWAANKYPGCGVDIPGLVYALSYFPNTKTTSLFPSQPDILAYVQRLAGSYNVHSHIRYSSRMIGAKWVEKSATWSILLENVHDGTRFTHEAKVLVSAVGAYTNPKYPDIDGIKEFEGSVVHTAQWDPKLNFAGRNVIVLGNGCSAAQVVPAIAPNVASLTQFMRNPQHYIPKAEFNFNYVLRLVLEVPLLNLLLRWILFWYLDSALGQFYDDANGARMREASLQISRDHVKKTAPSAYHDILIPKYEFGCRRRIVDAGYTSCLYRQNVKVTKDPISSISRHSVKTTSGEEYPADVIILATGFEFFTQWDLDIVGRNSTTVQQHWNKLGGREAYKTVAMNDFPNFFYLLGPNSGSGHTSVIFSSECAARLIIKLIRPILLRQARSVEADRAAEVNWCDSVQSALRKTVLAKDCGSHFVDPNTGWNHFSYPFSSLSLWAEAQWPMRSHWHYA